MYYMYLPELSESPAELALLVLSTDLNFATRGSVFCPADSSFREEPLGDCNQDKIKLNIHCYLEINM